MANPINNESMTPRDVRDGSGLTAEVHETNGAEHAVEPVDGVIGFNSTGWVGVAALVVVLIMLIKKVPAMIGRGLDAKIAAIRAQLDEATRLRTEAEALRAEYEAKARSAHADAETMREHARAEAHAIVTKAKADAEALMERRAKMAEDKIAAAERAAVAEVRARAADAAAQAAALLIGEQLGAEADRRLVDRTIGGLGRPN
jgi:F-type H+-transporting ATPase subunit b